MNEETISKRLKEQYAKRWAACALSIKRQELLDHYVMFERITPSGYDELEGPHRKLVNVGDIVRIPTEDTEDHTYNLWDGCADHMVLP